MAISLDYSMLMEEQSQKECVTLFIANYPSWDLMFMMLSDASTFFFILCKLDHLKIQHMKLHYFSMKLHHVITLLKNCNTFFGACTEFYKHPYQFHTCTILHYIMIR